jgi:hypothetical protein
VSIQGEFCRNREAGVMISNSSNVFVMSSIIENNAEHGILFQGRAGGRNCIVTNCRVQNNGTDIGHLHGSHGNWIFPASDAIMSFIDSPTNAKALEHFSGASAPWFSQPDVSRVVG